MNQPVGIQSKGRRSQLLDAARELMLTKGFAATTVDQICDRARVTKGSFFHYFDTKDDLARVLVEEFAEALFLSFQNAPFRELEDPVDQLLGYIDWTKAVCKDSILERGCLLGMFSLELAAVRPELRQWCADAFTGWAADLEQIIERAATARRPAVTVEPDALARHFISIVEGALILSKAHQMPGIVDESLDQFRFCVMSLLGKR